MRRSVLKARVPGRNQWGDTPYDPAAIRVLKVRAASVRLAQVLEAVCRGHQPTMIVRRRGAPVVLMSLADFRSLQASLHLLGGEANAVRLGESIAEFRAGKTVIRAWGRSADRRRS